MQWWASTGVRGYAVAVGAVAVALALRVALEPWLQGRLQFVTVFGAVGVAVWLGGMLPGVLAALLGLAGALLLLPVPLDTAGTTIALAGYALSAGIIVGFGSALRRTAERLREEVARRGVAELRARAAAERLDTTLRSIGDGVIVADAQGRVNALNPVAERLTGWAEGEARGRPLAEVFDILHETTREPVANPALRAIESGLVMGLANHTLLRARDGTERPIDDSAAPLRGRDGRIDGAVLVFRDFGARVAAERALRRGEALLRAIYETTTLCMGVVQPLEGEDDVLHLQDNAGTCRLFGVPPGGTAGRRASELGATPEILRLWCARYRQSAAAGAPVSFDFPLSEPGGTPRWHHATVSPLPPEPGQPLRFTYVSEDVTERRASERALAEADRRKNEFLATLAHELRNPLAPLAHGLALLRQAGDADPARRRRTLEMLERQVTLLVRLIEDLLDVSRIGRGLLELRRTRLDLVAAVQDGLDSAEPAVVAQRHRLTVSLPPQPLWVDGDGPRLSQVVANLVNNAARYTPEGGRIEVTLAAEGTQATLSVQDDGIGIAPAMQARVFEMFAQADRSSPHAQAGLGIGLAISRRLVELHGGRLVAHSEGVGHGSCFVVTLPLVQAEPAAPPADVAPPPSAPRPLRVLVVDDNVDAAESLRALLRLAGHEVDVAHDGPAALALAARRPPQLVLLDLGLPGIDGCEVARQLRAQSATAGATLVALTGWGQDADRRLTQASGFDHHLVKPMDPAALERLLAELAPA